MSFYDAWRNISARIKGLNEAAKLNALMHPNATSTGSTRFLQEQAREVFSELIEFHNRFKDILPIATIPNWHSSTFSVLLSWKRAFAHGGV